MGVHQHQANAAGTSPPPQQRHSYKDAAVRAMTGGLGRADGTLGMGLAPGAHPSHQDPNQQQQPGYAPHLHAQAKAVAKLVRERVAPLLSHPRLAPLNVCLPSVVTEFKHQASALGLMDLTTLVPTVSAAAVSPIGGLLLLFPWYSPAAYCYSPVELSA